MSLAIRKTLLLVIMAGAVLWLPLYALAAGGKISGKVIDADTKEGILGANVLIEGTSQGAAADLEGTFIIINLQPGTYTVKVTAQGYSSVRQTGVLVQSDLTTKLNFSLKTEVLEIGKEVEIVYTKPRVELDQTANTRTMSSEDLKSMVANNLTDVLTRQTGFTIDAEGNIHARGGRAEETLFIIDGTDMRDPLVNTKIDFDLNSMNIQELQILTGGFNAEYGKAQSAIINVTTKEGAQDRYNGQLKYSTDNLIKKTSFNTDRIELSTGGPIPFTKGMIGKPITFFFSGTANLSDTYTPLNTQRSANDYMDIGIKLPQRTDNEYSASLKLAYQLTGNKKLTLTTNEYFRHWDIFPDGEGPIGGDYGWRYKYDTQNRPYAVNKRNSVSLNFTHQISDKTFYEVQLSRFATLSQVRPGGGVTPGDFTLQSQAEDQINIYRDTNGDGIIDAADLVKHIPFTGYVDANNNGQYDGGGEGYEDLNGNGKWDRGEDWVDLNHNGIYDYAEPWTDIPNPVTGVNNIGVYDPWDPYTDLNHNGHWDPAEPQLPEQDWNHNGHWDGERFWDANGDGKYEGWGEGYYDANMNGRIDKKMNYTVAQDVGEPYWDGDYYHDTGEPFIDTPDENGFYNGVWDPGEVFFDLPSSNTNPAAGNFIYGPPTLNGRYDGPNGYFDEYELFTYPADLEYGYNPAEPVLYTYDKTLHGAEWVNTNFWLYRPGKSTWSNLKDVQSGSTEYMNRAFNPPNYQYDPGEPFVDYNGNGVRDGVDHFLNPDQWDENAYWYDRSTVEYTLKADFTSQISKTHELKTGVELRQSDMQMQSISGPDMPYNNPDVVLPSGSPWPDRGDVRDFYHYRPWEGSVYVQDKMEFEGLIVNAGLRSDFIIHDPTMVDASALAVSEGQPGAVLASRGTYQIAPRLGISHPITDRSKLYFNYGHFYQAPQYQYFFKSNAGNIIPGSFVGNPNLKMEKTVQYAMGVQTQVTEDLSFDVEGYYKDIYGLISTLPQYIVSGYTLDRYVNLDYGRVRGFEVSVDNNFSRNFTLSLKWDFSYAYGKASSALAAQAYRLSNVPVNKDEHPLDWDETHVINIYSTLIYQKGQHPDLFGLKLPDNWLLTLEWRYGSGEPYTPTHWTTGIPDEQIQTNSARYPWHEVTNLKFEKYFTLRGSTNLVAGIQVNNLFDTQNVNTIYPETGNAYDSTSPLDLVNALTEPYPGPYNVGTDYDHDPRNYDPPRQIIFSLGVQF